MICPAKLCKKEIPDDSLYCDQCGLQILHCVKCGAKGIGKFCGKCGGQLVFEPLPAQTSSASAKASTPEPKPSPTGAGTVAATIASTSGTATQVVSLAPSHITLHHNDGWSMTVSSGDILGRATGNFTSQLSKFPVISSKHAKIDCDASGNWTVTDLHSTNKTYVNSTPISPDVPAPLAENDVISLANVQFVVRFA